VTIRIVDTLELVDIADEQAGLVLMGFSCSGNLA